MQQVAQRLASQLVHCRERNAALNPDACKCSQIYYHVGSNGVKQSLPDNREKGHGRGT